MKRLLYVFISALIAALCLTASAEPWEETVGKTLPDFELTCADGNRFCLSEALADKELAVVCLFGSGCGACQQELRALNLAWQLYQDQVAAIGLSLDRTYDTDEVLLQFARERGIAFPLGRDPARTARFMQINMYPAFMIVDSACQVRYIEVNGEASIDHFVELFDQFLGEESAVTEGCTPEGCPLPDTAQTGSDAL